MRIRAEVFGTKERPRLSFHKSQKRIRVQIIDDDRGMTLVGITSVPVKGKTQTQQAHEIGKELAKKAKVKKIQTVVFDRGGFLYTGKVKAFAEGARKGGLVF